jgi:SAM-dependent methyltransferase
VLSCPVCRNTTWRDTAIIWPELAAEWRLSDTERDYVDRQQGTACTACGTTLRSAALARGICQHFGCRGSLRSLAFRWPLLRILEVNEAGTLTPTLSRWRHHTLARYPDVDIQQLPQPDASVDVVVHSDTLEHVADPLRGLQECRRVLRPGGLLAYTIPIILGRMSRRRDFDPPSYHGSAQTREYLVHTEYGADFWTQPAAAGFSEIAISVFEYPAALAVLCTAP